MELSDAAKEVLIEIYIGQNIRDEGILQSQVKNVEEINKLLSLGLIKQSYWYLQQLQTTDEGNLLANRIITQSIDENSFRLSKKLSLIPPKLLAFFIKRYISKKLNFSLEKELYGILNSKDSWTDAILRNTEVWSFWNKFFEILIAFNLCQKTIFYVSSNGGQTRDYRYVISPETRDFLTMNFSIEDLSVREESILRSYSFLRLIKNSIILDEVEQTKKHYHEISLRCDIDEEIVRSIIKMMNEKNITSDYQGLFSTGKPYIIFNETVYEIFLEKEIVNPAALSLLQQSALEKTAALDVNAKPVSGEIEKASKFNVFICYRRITGQDFAEHLKASLESLGLTAFLDIQNIPEKFKGTEKWADKRDDAILYSGTFLMIITAGFCESEEIKRELSLALKAEKDLICFRHKSVVLSDLKIKLQKEIFDLSKLQLITFETKYDLTRIAYKLLFEKKDLSDDNSSTPALPPTNLQVDYGKKKKWEPLPVIKFNLMGSHLVRSLPQVGWELTNHSPYQLKIRIEIHPWLGDRDLYTLIMDPHITGKKLYSAEPNSVVWTNGTFTLPSECQTSTDELVVEIRSFVTDINEPEKGEHKMLSSTWKYVRSDDYWYYYPQGP